ncbi:MAG: hypothetical protein GY906_28715 [bacterium]|nr:hypothetical protein [bacterium]
MSETQSCEICGEGFSEQRPREACHYCDRAVCVACVELDIPDHHDRACRECIESWDPYRQLREASPRELISTLANPTGMDRGKTVDLVCAQKLNEAVPVLIGALKGTKDNHLRQKIVAALRQFADGSAVPVLVAALKDSYPDVRSEAALALGEMKVEAATKPLKKALKDADDSVVASVAKALGQLGAQSATRTLGKVLKRRKEGVGRWEVVIALGEIGGADAIKILTAALADDDRWVRHYAATALINLDPQDESELRRHLL